MQKRHELDTPENVLRTKRWYIVKNIKVAGGSEMEWTANWLAMEPSKRLKFLEIWIKAGKPYPTGTLSLKDADPDFSDCSDETKERARTLFVWAGLDSNHAEQRENEWETCDEKRRNFWFYQARLVEIQHGFKIYMKNSKAREIYLSPDAYEITLRLDPEFDMPGEHRKIHVPKHTKEVVIKRSGPEQSFEESEKVLAKEGIQFRVENTADSMGSLKFLSVEKAELEKSLEKLESFIYDHDSGYADVNEKERHLLNCQLVAMGQYCSILQSRMNGFKVRPGDKEPLSEFGVQDLETIAKNEI